MIRAVDFYATSSVPPPSHAIAVADRCRAAALAFLRARGWGKPELATWLSGAYGGVAVKVRDEDDAPPSSRSVGPLTISALIDRTRADVVATLAGPARHGGLFATKVRAAGLVTSSFRDGERVLLPVDRARVLLSDRVLSLFAADYLARPGEFEATLSVCPRCDEVSFDRRCRHVESGMSPRRMTLALVEDEA